jgi:unspecific peroxygenase
MLARSFLFACGLPFISAISHYRSLAGLTEGQIEHFVRQSTVPIVGAQPVPPRQNDTSAKLVNDVTHQFVAAGSNDIRGPCPGLNTLASHGVSTWIGISPLLLVPYMLSDDSIHEMTISI